MNVLPRLVEPRLRQALGRGKSVLLLGPSQTGKTTLLERLKPDVLSNPICCTGTASPRSPAASVRDRRILAA